MKSFTLLFALFFATGIFGSDNCKPQLSLEDVWTLVVDNHEQIKTLYIENYQATLNIRQTLFRLLPCVGASASVTYSNPTRVVEGLRIIPTSFKAASLTVSQSIVDLRLKPFYLSAKLAKEATCHHSEFEIYEIIYSTSEAYVAVLQSGDLLHVSKNQLALVHEQYVVVKERYERGEVPISDLLQSEGEVNRAERVLNDVCSDLLIYQEHLSNLIGIEVGSYQLISPFCVDLCGGNDLCYLVQEACNRRQDLKSIACFIEAAKQQIKALKRTNWPRLDFLGEYTLASPEVLDCRNNSWNAALWLNVPLFDGGINCLNVKNAKAELIKQQLIYDRLIKDLKLKVKTAYYEFTSEKTNCDLLQNELSLSQENYEILAQRYKRGQATNIDLMDALNTYIQVQANYAIAKYNLILLSLKLNKETGFFDELINKKCTYVEI